MKHAKNVLLILAVLCLDLLVQAVGFVVVPVALLFCKPTDAHLPTWAHWFETYDYDINGDPPWQGPQHANGHQREYWWRLLWLLRNRTGIFSTDILGFQQSQVMKYEAWGDVYTGNIPGHSGWLYAEATLPKGRMRPCYYIVYQWPKSRRCFRLYAGWKFRQAQQVRYWPKIGVAEFVVSVNPLQRFEEVE